MLQKNSKEISTGYFGKLPDFNDFIKFNSGLPEILFIDKWIQNGLADARLKLKSDWKWKYETLPPTNFYIPFPSSERAAAGVIYSSNDKSGREFPLVIFSIISLRNFATFAFVPAVLQEIIEMLDYFLRKEENLNDLNSTLKNFIPEIKNEASFNNGFQAFLSSTTISSLQDRTGITAENMNPANLTFSDTTCIRISFNSDNSNFNFDTAFFVKLLNKKINLSPGHSSIFWNNTDDSQFNLTIFPFKLNSINFLDLISPDNQDSRIINIDSSGEVLRHADSNDFNSDTSLGNILQKL